VRESERWTRLEESVLFAERRLDELHEQVLEVSARLEALGRRLREVEGAVGRLADPGPEGEDGPPGPAPG
jgi:uncharacterized coiled-coil protein SlyX